MSLFKNALLSMGVVAALTAVNAPAFAQNKVVVGVSWGNFQEERYKIDEAAIKGELAKEGASYIAADAQSSPSKQQNDVDSLITRGANVLVIDALDTSAIVPAVERAKAAGIPVIAYDRLIEDKGVFYITFDNVGVGRLQAQAIYAVQPKGNYALIKGSSTDLNSDFLHQGQMEVLGPAIKKGDIKIVGEEYTDNWLPANAQREMEQILTKTNNKVDAAVVSNDGMAGGVVAALTAQGMQGIPVSGQDGDAAALNRIARGLQTVDVWKDVRVLGATAAKVAVQLANKTPMDKIDGSHVWASGPKKIPMDSILLPPIAITKNNLDVVLKAGWIKKDVLCQGVDAAKAPAACK